MIWYNRYSILIFTILVPPWHIIGCLQYRVFYDAVADGLIERRWQLEGLWGPQLGKGVLDPWRTKTHSYCNRSPRKSLQHVAASWRPQCKQKLALRYESCPGWHCTGRHGERHGWLKAERERFSALGGHSEQCNDYKWLQHIWSYLYTLTLTRRKLKGTRE